MSDKKQISTFEDLYEALREGKELPELRTAPGTKSDPLALARTLESVDYVPETAKISNTEEKADSSPLKESVSIAPAPKLPAVVGVDKKVPTKESEKSKLEKSIYDALQAQSEITRPTATTSLYSGEEGRKRAEERLERAETAAAYGRLASQIGNSLAQLFAAQKGLKEGVDLSNINTETPDFKQFLDSAARRYKASLEEEARKEGLSVEERDKEQRRLDTAFADAINKATVSRAGNEFLLGRLTDEEKAEQQAAEAARRAGIEREELGLRKSESARKGREAAIPKEDTTLLREQIKANAAELKQTQGQLEAANSLAGIIQRYPELSSKGREAADKEIAELTGKAGLSATKVAETMDVVEENRGGLFSKGNPEAIKKALDDLATEQRQRFNTLRSTQQELLQVAPARQQEPVRPRAEQQPISALSTEDRQAFEWAKSNLGDPRSDKILNNLRTKYTVSE